MTDEQEQASRDGTQSALDGTTGSAPDGIVAKAEPPGGQKPRGPSQAAKLVQLASFATLFHDRDGIAYAAICPDVHLSARTWPLRSKGFREWLAREYYFDNGAVPNAQATQDALGVLAGRAVHDGPEAEVAVRIGEHDDDIYLDLGDEDWRTIRVTADDWEVLKGPSPVRFIRRPGMRPLPIPQPGGVLNRLWAYVNIAEEADRKLVVGWLLQALRPAGPYPVLVLQGEQGSAKTSAARFLRALVDPSKTAVRTVPRDERDLVVAARNSWIVALDNLSGLKPWLSDALCRIATGGGFATRALFTDGDEFLVDVTRPVIVNGIEDIAVRQDLVDRALVVTLPTIPDHARRTEAGLWADFERDRPYLIGALLDAVSGALRALPNVNLPVLPRMADHCTWVTAAESSLDWVSGSFLRAYTGNREAAVETGLEASPVAVALRTHLEQCNGFEGTASALLEVLDSQVTEGIRRSREWPKGPNRLSNEIRRLAPAMRRVGIGVGFHRNGSRRTIRIEQVGQRASLLSRPSEPAPDWSGSVDGAYDGHGDVTCHTGSEPSQRNAPYFIGYDPGDDCDDRSRISSEKEVAL